MGGMIEILDELVEQIRSAYASNPLDIQVERRYVVNPTPPTIDIYPGDPARDAETAAFDDVAGGYIFTVRTRIATAAFDETYDFLLETMDDEHANCLPLVVLTDDTLNGLASDIDIRDPSGLRAYENLSGEGALLGWQFVALVIPAKS